MGSILITLYMCLCWGFMLHIPACTTIIIITFPLEAPVSCGSPISGVVYLLGSPLPTFVGFFSYVPISFWRTRGILLPGKLCIYSGGVSIFWRLTGMSLTIMGSILRRVCIPFRCLLSIIFLDMSLLHNRLFIFLTLCYKNE